MWTMAEAIKTCKNCGKVLTTKQAELSILCEDCWKAHAKKFEQDHYDFPPDTIKKLKENGY